MEGMVGTSLKFRLYGFKSTSMSRDVAEAFMYENQAKGLEKTLYVIKWQGLYDCLNTDFISEYPDEQEVILNDGLSFDVESVQRGQKNLNGELINIVTLNYNMSLCE